MRSPASAAIMASSSGVMKRAQSCVPAGTTAAAVLALIVTLDPPTRPMRDPRPAISPANAATKELTTAARPTEETLGEAIPLDDAPVTKRESLAQADASTEASADKSGPADRFASGPAAPGSADASLAAVPAPAGPAPAVVASKRMEEIKQLQVAEGEEVGLKQLVDGPGSSVGGSALGMNGQGPPGGGGRGSVRGMMAPGAGMMPDRLADGKAGPSALAGRSRESRRFSGAHAAHNSLDARRALRAQLSAAAAAPRRGAQALRVLKVCGEA
jgi:hypothetical protein